MMIASLRLRGVARYAVVAALALASCRSTSPSKVGSPAPQPVTRLGQFKALLINGGGRAPINFQSHLTHVRTLVEFLRAHDVSEHDIVIFSSDGDDPAADLTTRALDSEPDTWLLPPGLAHRLRPIQLIDSVVPGYTLHPATREALRNWFETDGRQLGSGDTLLLYVTDHGEQNKKDLTNNTIVLWQQSLPVSELRELFKLLNPGVRVVMLMSQCYSGSFANALFEPGTGLTTNGNVCGYFASTADRPAYGCYPENRGLDGVGHSHHFFDALNALGRMSEAENRVQVTDDSPDVPHTTSDFYLQQLIAGLAQKSDRQPLEVADELIGHAFHNRAQWEPEIRLMDRVGTTFGMFSPRSLAELELQTKMLPHVSDQLRTYARRWDEALDALTVQNFERFLNAQPEWRPRVDVKAIDALSNDGRSQLAHDLLAALVAYTKTDRETYTRLQLLKQRADSAGAAAYRMEVRLGVVLRMRAVLEEVAGRVYLSESGTPAERSTYTALRACEDVNFLDSPEYASAAAMDPPERFPPLDEDRQTVTAVMPAWMGIQFRSVSETIYKKEKFPRGAVTVMAVYPGSAAANAGIEVGDVILGPPDAPFTEPQQVREWTMRREIGEPAPLTVARGGQTMQITLHPEPYPMKMPELPGPPKVGSAAPPLKLEPFRGDRAFAAGHPRLLFFWATWCVPCKAALPEVLAFAKSRGIEVVAVTDEDPDTLTAFFDQFKQPFPDTVATDPFRTAFQTYGVSGTPTFVLIDGDGVVQYYHSGYNPSVGLGIEGWTYEARPKKADAK
jgi:thiol-disulfide isomerase/thioredoxin